MEIALGIIVIFIIYMLWKLFMEGWLFKIILFFAGWFGMYVACSTYIDGANQMAITIGTNDPITFSWATVIPTVICFVGLLTVRVKE